jgi:hypothetical protein
MAPTRAHAQMLNLAHLLDHFFLLIFPTAVLAISQEWQLSFSQLLPLTLPAMAIFGLGALPAGWLADRWSRRGMWCSWAMRRRRIFERWPRCCTSGWGRGGRWSRSPRKKIGRGGRRARFGWSRCVPWQDARQLAYARNSRARHRSRSLRSCARF